MSDASFAAHVARVVAAVERALTLAAEAGQEFSGVVFHSGGEAFYHRQDRPVPFVADAHFRRLCPGAEPGTFVVHRPGERPRLVRSVSHDYWHDAPAPWPAQVCEPFDFTEVEGAAARGALGRLDGMAFVGGDAACATALGFADSAIEPEALMAPLDWARAYKTPYEVACIAAAGAAAARGHGVVAAQGRQGRSERALHAAYLAQSGQLELDTPYTNIIAWDDHSATLHYADKLAEPPDPGHVLLIDAGATDHGYASDITRTHAFEGAHPVFIELLSGMHTLQRALVAAVAPGVRFETLHRRAEREICELLRRAGVLRGDVDQALERGVAGTFMPHGLGHFLGLEVHDAGGRQRDERGGVLAPPSDLPFLRTTRTLERDQVVTIEPGLYFIPMLLDKLQQSPASELVEWKLCQALVPSGGIRIEDDVLVTDAGFRDLTCDAVAAALEEYAPRGPDPDQPGYR